MNSIYKIVTFLHDGVQLNVHIASERYLDRVPGPPLSVVSGSHSRTLDVML
jgi:hypothetical protein